jgi:hypothetical protein
MRKTKFTEEQMIDAVKQLEAAVAAILTCPFFLYQS